MGDDELPPVPDEIKDFLLTLNELERRLLELRFGFDRGEPRTLEEIGEIVGLTRAEIQAAVATAMSRLTNP